MYKVLLVDDEPLITKGLMALLDWEDYGFEIVYTAESGEEAFSFLKENQVDILLTDILMGEMSGLELISETKKIHPQIKCIVLTGYQEFGLIKQGLLLGIENYLVKPVDEEELLTTIKNTARKLNSVKEPDSLQDTTTLQDNTLWRFVNGEIEKRDCLERLSFYNIELNQPYYTISILNIEHFHKAEVLKDTRDLIEKQYSATCFYSPNQEIVIIFGSTSEEDLFTCNQHLVNQLRDVPRGTGIFYLSKGKSVSSIDELEESYSCAKEYSLFQLYSEPNTLISNPLSIDKQDELKKQQEFKDNIVKQLFKAEEATLQIIDQFYEDLAIRTKLISPLVAKKYTFDLISFIHYSIQSDDLSHYTAAIERIAYSTDINQMKAILKEYCNGLILSINNHANMRSPIVQNVLHYIHANFDQGISLKTLGQQFHVNVIYLGQLFQKEVGVVFSEYLNRYRLEKAKELLKTTHYRAGEIGKRVGYSDTTYFYKQFKKNVGTTPSEWRKI